MEPYIRKLTLEQKAALLQGWSTWTTWDGNKLASRPFSCPTDLTACASRRERGTTWA